VDFFGSIGCVAGISLQHRSLQIFFLLIFFTKQVLLQSFFATEVMLQNFLSLSSPLYGVTEESFAT